MTWTRVKRWCGTHAPWAVTVVTAAAQVLGAVMCVVIFHALKENRIDDRTVVVLLLATMGGTLLAAMVAAIVVTVIVVRAGLPQAAPLGGLKYALPIAVLHIITFHGGLYLMGVRNVEVEGIPMVFSMTLWTMLAQFIGWAIGLLFGRWKVRRGAWEFTRPPSAEWERPTFPVRHPAATVVMVATAMGFVLGLLDSSFGAFGENPLAWGFLFLYVPVVASMFGCGFFVTYRRRRFDLSSWPVMVGCLLSAVTSAAMIAGTVRLCGQGIYGRLDWNLVLKFLAIEVAIGTAAGVLGALGSELRYRRAVRRGAWEFARTGDAATVE